MPNRNDLEVALRIKAQTEGKQDVDDLGHSLSKLGDGTDQSLRELESELDALANALRKPGDEADKTKPKFRSAGEAMREAFGVAGVRSAAQIQTEIHKIDIALQRLGTDAKVSGADFTRAWAAGQEKIRALEAEMRGAAQAAEKMGGGAQSLISGFKGAAAAIAGMQVAREFLQANIAIESLERVLTQTTGSAAGARQEIDWLKDASNKLGINALEASKAYVSLSVATKGTALEGQRTHEIFTAVAGAMAKLGKSGADTEGALQAVSQMVSKGTVSMEEFRQQLAERLPGAMQATATAMGVTVSDLNEMIESGNVLAVDLLPKLAEGLNKAYGSGPSEGTLSAWNRLKNSINETFEVAGKNGFMDGVIKALEWANTAVKLLTGSFVMLGKTWGTIFAGMATFDFKRPIESAKFFAGEMKALFDEWTKGNREALDGTTKVDKSQQTVAESVKKTSEAASEQSQAWLSVVAAYSKSTKAAEGATAIAVKAAAARQEESKASLAVVQALGGEAEKRDAASRAAATDAGALRAVADARREEARVAAEQARALAEAAAAEGALSADKEKQIKASQDNAAAKQAEADKSIAAARAAEQHAAILKVQSEALKDNSGRVDELRVANDQAQASLARVRAEHAAGKATLDEVAAAETRAVSASALYRDALRDVTTAIQNKAAAAKGANAVEQAQANLTLQRLRNEAALASAMGDEQRAIELKNEASRIEAKLSTLKAEAMRAEVAARLELIKAKRAELIASGELTPAKQAELNAMNAAVKVMQLEAEMADENARHLREMASATHEVGTAAGQAGSGLRTMQSDLAGVATQAGRAAGELQRLRNEQVQMGSAGGSETGAPTQNGGIERPDNQLTPSEGPMVTRDTYGFNTSNEDVARTAGMRGDDVARFSEVFGGILADKLADMRANLSTFSIGSPKSYTEAYSSAYKAAIEEAKIAARETKGADGKPKPEPVKTVRLDLNINGVRTPVNVNSDKDAQALMDALKSGFEVASS